MLRGVRLHFRSVPILPVPPLPLLTAGLACLLTTSVAAQAVNTSALSQNGWFADDTRADGSGTQSAGTNLKSPSLTAAPESLSGSVLHESDIHGQINFGAATGVPAGTHAAAMHLKIAAGSSSGKSQASHRKEDATGHGPGSSFGAGFTAQYSWMGNGTSSITTSLKFGIKTSEFPLAPISTRTGENAWDKLLIYEPGNGNGGTSDGLWHTETINFTTGKWWVVDRLANVGNTIGNPMTLSAMVGSAALTGGSSPKTVGTIYSLITAPGALITSVQFGIGSGNPGGNVYVNQLTTSAYRPGQITTFGTPSLLYDQNVTPDAIYGGGNANGSFTVHRASGVELGMRGKLRYPASNIFKSNGDGTYTFNTGSGTGPITEAEWAFEFSANTDWAGVSGDKLNDLTYQIGIDHDASANTNYAAWDVITPGSVLPFTGAPLSTFWDHSIGNNLTPNGGGVEAGDALTYATLLSTGNVAQQSWRMTFYDLPPFPVFNPNVPGRYDFYLAAFNGSTQLARTEIAILALSGTTVTVEADTTQADAFPGTPGVQNVFKVWLRNPADIAVTGHQEFLQFNDTAMTYVGSLSSYPATPFNSHIQAIATAEVSPGKLRLDGNAFGGSGTSGDALLATLVFTVSECSLNSVDFDLGQPFPTQLSNLGLPLATALLDSPDVLADNTAPVITPAANVTKSADAGSCTQAVVTFPTPVATDSCDPTPTVVCSPPSGSVFPVGTTVVTCTATDDCGNSSTSTFNVTVTPTNLVDVVVNLVGSGPTSRCIRFQLDSCSAFVDLTLPFTGSNPAVATATIEVPCGVWTKICAKDRQHTKWDDALVTISGQKYVATTTLVLDAGDTDNDGDVDINDVTWFLTQFGGLASSGGCPWNGTTRDADFDNDGAVGSPDYSSLVANWLTTSSCPCTISLPGGAGGERERLAGSSIGVHDELTRAADLDRNGVVDYRDVALFEARHGLSGELSERMRRSQR
jgi:HYR domain